MLTNKRASAGEEARKGNKEMAEGSSLVDKVISVVESETPVQKEKPGPSKETELALVMKRPSSTQNPSEAGVLIQAKLGGYPMCPGVRMANSTSRSCGPPDSLRHFLATESRPPRPLVSYYIDLTSDGESTVRRAPRRSSPAEASGLGRPSDTVKQ